MVSKLISSFVESLGFSSKQAAPISPPPQQVPLNEGALSIPMDKLQGIKQKAHEKLMIEQKKSQLKTMQGSKSHQKLQRATKAKLKHETKVDRKRRSTLRSAKQDHSSVASKGKIDHSDKLTSDQQNSSKLIEKCFSPRILSPKLEPIPSAGPATCRNNLNHQLMNGDISDDEVPQERVQLAKNDSNRFLNIQKERRPTKKSISHSDHKNLPTSLNMNRNSCVDVLNNFGDYKTFSYHATEANSKRESKISSKITATTITPIKYDYKLKGQIKEVSNFEEESPSTRTITNNSRQEFVLHTFAVTKLAVPPLVSVKSQPYDIHHHLKLQNEFQSPFEQQNSSNSTDKSQFFPSLKSTFSYQPKYFKPSLSTMNNTNVTSQQQQHQNNRLDQEEQKHPKLVKKHSNKFIHQSEDSKHLITTAGNKQPSNKKSNLMSQSVSQKLRPSIDKSTVQIGQAAKKTIANK